MDQPRKRILVIDDSIDILELCQLAFESAGHEVKVAANGADGLELVRSFGPHLIITDLSMPRMNGFEFLVRLRSDFAPPLPQVVVCSGFDGTAEEALRLGAIFFVAKPIEPAALLSIVEQALRGEVGDASSLARERDFIQAARARAAAAAARVLRGIDLHAPELVSVFTRAVQWVSSYFGYAEAGAVFAQDEGDILVAAVSRGSPIPAGSTFSGKLLYAAGTLASGSSLILPDTEGIASIGDPRPSKLGLRFLIAVPLVIEGVAVGALCLLDRKPHECEAEDVLILQQLGRFAATALGKTLRQLRERTLTGQNVGLVPPAVFDSMLAAELSILHRERGGLDLMFVEVVPASLRRGWVASLLGQSRFGMCRRNAGTLALFKRDSTPTAAPTVLSKALAALRTVAAVRAVGWVSIVDEGLTRVPHQVLLQLGDVALAGARLAPARPVERIVIRPEGCP